MKKESNKKNYKLIVSILFTIFLLVGITYAAWNYLSERTNIVMSIDGNRINFNAGQDIVVNNMLPVYDQNDGVVKTMEVYEEESTYASEINLFLDLTTFPSSLANKSFRWMLYKNGKMYNMGDFNGKQQGDTINLTNSYQKVNTQANKDTYTLYIWIDAFQATDSTVISESFTVNVYGKVGFSEGGNNAVETAPNDPDLIDGMIPVKYDETTSSWKKANSANTNNDWYDYSTKYWANAVLVTSATRTTYMNASVNTPVLEDDILAYYVWIPRYKYQLFNVNSAAIDPQEIKIEFQGINNTIENGDENGEWLTHPAFWWDDNSDGVRDPGEELSGIWVGKFETGGISTNPLIKPNILSARDYKLSQMFNISVLFSTSNYLTNTGALEADSHMIKNMEWGAVAYLSHSKYGINTEVCINNSGFRLSASTGGGSAGYVTGRSGGNVSGSVNALKLQYPTFSSSNNPYNGTGYYTYNDLVIDYNGNYSSTKDVGLGTCASTTGNISGVYDMSGGIYELVMGIQKSSSGTITYYGSGFSENTMPEAKYYDLYEYGTNGTASLRRKLGDATEEVKEWYGDRVEFVKENNNGVFYRGNGAGNNSKLAGIFSSDASNGSGSYNFGSRAVLIKP